MHGKKKHCSHEVYLVVEQMLNVNFVLAGSLQVRYKDTPDVQIVLDDMLWSLFWRQFVVWPAASAVGVERPWHLPTKATAEQHVPIDSELSAVCPNFELRNHIVDCYNSPAWHTKRCCNLLIYGPFSQIALYRVGIVCQLHQKTFHLWMLQKISATNWFK